MGLHEGHEAFVRLHGALLTLVGALTACELGSGPALAGDAGVDDPMGSLSAQDVRVQACIQRHPQSRHGLGELDPELVRARCVARFGETTEICDTDRWVSLDAALCVARSAQLDPDHPWRAQLRISHTFPPAIYYRIRLSSGEDPDDERDVDARTGALLWRF